MGCVMTSQSMVWYLIGRVWSIDNVVLRGPVGLADAPSGALVGTIACDPSGSIKSWQISIPGPTAGGGSYTLCPDMEPPCEESFTTGPAAGGTGLTSVLSFYQELVTGGYVFLQLAFGGAASALAAPPGTKITLLQTEEGLAPSAPFDIEVVGGSYVVVDPLREAPPFYYAVSPGAVLTRLPRPRPEVLPMPKI